MATLSLGRHHAAADGWRVSRSFEEMQEAMDGFDRYLCAVHARFERLVDAGASRVGGMATAY